MGDMEDIDDEAIDGDMVSQPKEEIWRISRQGRESFQGRLVSGMASLTRVSETRCRPLEAAKSRDAMA